MNNLKIAIKCNIDNQVQAEQQCVQMRIYLNLLYFSWIYLNFAVWKKKWVTDRRTDGPTDRQMDKAFYRDAWTHLKSADRAQYLTKKKKITFIVIIHKCIEYFNMWVTACLHLQIDYYRWSVEIYLRGIL